MNVAAVSSRHLLRLEAVVRHCLSKMSVSVKKDSVSNSNKESVSSSNNNDVQKDNLGCNDSLHSLNRNIHRETKGEQSTAGIIVIGDEILKGQTLDTNSNFICKKLFSLGVKVEKISVIPDDVNVIAEEVAWFSERFTHVITSGGIGPTHDDMTFEGVAKAFGLKTIPHPDLVQLITDWFKVTDLDSAEMKMAKIPENAKLTFGIDPKSKQESKYPLVSLRNVYIFPGVPKLCEKLFVMLGHLFQDPNVQFYTNELYVNKDEPTIAASISQVADKYKGTVTIGSYPDIINSYYKVKLTLESVNASSLQEATKELAAIMPQGSVVSYDNNPILSAVSNVYKIVESSDLSNQYTLCVKQAVETLEQALQRYQ